MTTGCFFGYLIQQLYHRGEDNARHWLYTLNSWFPERTFVEIQNHFITHEDGTTDDSTKGRAYANQGYVLLVKTPAGIVATGAGDRRLITVNGKTCLFKALNAGDTVEFGLMSIVFHLPG